MTESQVGGPANGVTVAVGSGDAEAERGRTSRVREARTFLCYRRNDGAWHAEWLNDCLKDVVYTDRDGTTCRVQLYYDKTAPGVANWKQIHFPSLQTAHALLLICTPGIAKDLSKRGQPDWVYEELSWWTRHRNSAPIVIDATGEGDRWLPEMVTSRWPDINRIDVHREDAEAAILSRDSSFSERIRQRIIASIQQSEHASVFEDLERSKKLARRLKFWLSASLLFLVAAALTSVLALRFSRQATASLSGLLEEQGRAELLFGDPSRAVVFLSEVYAQGRHTDSVRALLADAMRLVDFRQPPLVGSSPLVDADFAPDGAQIVTADQDGTAQIWDVASHRPVHALSHGEYVASVAYDPQGLRIATIGFKVPAKVWNAGSGKELFVLEQTMEGHNVQFSPMGDRLLAGGREGIKVWDTQSGRLVAQAPPLPGYLPRATFDATGSLILSINESEIASVWNARNGRLVHTMNHNSKLHAACFSRSGDEAITGAHDGVVYIWNVETGAQRTKLGEQRGAFLEGIHSLVSSPDGIHLATGTMDGLVSVWNLATGERIWQATKHRMNVMAIAYDPAGTRIATAGRDGTAKIWDAATGTLLADLVGHSDSLRAVHFSPDGNQLLTASDDRTARLWNLRPLKRRATLSASRQRALSGTLVDNGQRVIGTTPDNRVNVWRTSTGAVERTFGLGITEFAVSESGARLLSCDGEYGRMGLRLWNLAGGVVIREFGPHEYMWARFLRHNDRVIMRQADRAGSDHRIERLQVIDGADGHSLFEVAEDPGGDVDTSEDGSVLAIAASGSGGVSLFNSDTGRMVKRLAMDRFSPHIWLSPDGRHLLLTTTSITKGPNKSEFVVGHPVEVWDVRSGALRGLLKGHTDGIIDLAFSPDSAWAVSVSLDRSGRVWDLARLSLLAKMEGHTRAVRSAAFSRNGQRIATTSEDGTARVWEAKSGRLLATLDASAGSEATVDAAQFDDEGGRLLTIGRTLVIWDVGLETRSPQQIREIVRREVPWVLVSGQLASREVHRE
jgi:WD40 repeat protein